MSHEAQKSASRATVAIVDLETHGTRLAERISTGLNGRGTRTVVCSASAIPATAVAVIMVARGGSDPLHHLVKSRLGPQKVVLVLQDGRDAHKLLSRGLTSIGVADLLLADSCDLLAELHQRIGRWQEVHDALTSRAVVDRMLGSGTLWRNLLSSVVEVACFTQDSILLTGESGTGKELFARLVHDLDRRADKEHYVILDCTTIVQELSGSEFFGHERGAFTGAHASRDGAFALADGGTLFLDEIGELPAPLQAQLLRVIQEGMYKRVGSNAWRRTKFRLVCATNKNLEAEMSAGRFRRDLYYRIAQWTFRLPTLGERVDDIVPLARFFLNDGRERSRALRFDPVVEHYLRHRSYPGNIRELKLLVSRLRLRHDGSGVITVGCIPSGELQSLEAGPVGKFEPGSWSRAPGLTPPTLNSVTNTARLEAIRATMADEMSLLGHRSAKRALVLRRTADRLGCTLRWIQICDKEHRIFASLCSQDP